MASNEGDLSCDSGTRRSRGTRSVGKRGRGRKKATPTTRSTRSKRNVLAAEVVENDDVPEDVPEEQDTEDDPVTEEDPSKDEDDIAEATSEDGDKLFHSFADGNTTENGVEETGEQLISEEYVDAEESVALNLDDQEEKMKEEGDIYDEDSKVCEMKRSSGNQDDFGESSIDSSQVKHAFKEESVGDDELSCQELERPEKEESGISSLGQSNLEIKLEYESCEESQNYSNVVEDVEYPYQEEITETNESQSSQIYRDDNEISERETQDQDFEEEGVKSFVHEENENMETECIANDSDEKLNSMEESGNNLNGDSELHDDSDSLLQKKEVQEENADSNFQTEPDTEMVSEDELPTESSKEPLETEAVSDEELPEPATAVDLPETEAVSEDELPPEKTDKKKKKALASKSSEGEVSGEISTTKKKRSEAPKRKLSEGDTYDPSSPTSENSCDESPAAKRAAVAGSGSTPQAKPVTKTRKSLPELDKYWKAVTEDPSDFTGWTYLLQYVDQENDIEAAREAYDAFLSHYPYCYGYWRKYADYEKRKGNKEKCEDVFERGLKAIPLSVDLWIHYLNYCKATYPDEEDHLRTQFEKAISACGMEFRSDKLWESYIKWETEGKRLQNVTALYDRLLTVPTQGYTKHFDNFQEHIGNNPPQKVLSVDEFLTLRREVLQLLKQYDQPLTAAADDGAPGEEVEAPPGEESEEQPAVKSDEETTALRERIISIRRKIHKNTVAAVADRWHYEEGIKRPYFHVKPLERCQLKNWIEYLDYEIEQGDKDRIIILFERCLIACALYEEFWIKFICYLESLSEDMTDKIRNVYERACTIHHTKKPNLHLHWAVFEESLQNYDKASEILSNLEKLVPNMLQVAYRRINLERRRNNLDKVCALYEHYITSSKNKVISNNMAIKYARFCWKIKGDVEKAILILNKAVEKDKENPRLYLQLIDMGLQRSPLNEDEILYIIDQFLNRDADPEQKVLFAQRKVEFMEDFGSDVLSVQKAHDEFQKYLKMAKDRKKKSPDIDGKMGDGTSKKKNQTGTGDVHSVHTGSHSSSQSPHSGSGSQAPQPPSGATVSTTTAGASQYPPPSYAQAGGYSQPPPAQSGYQGGQYPPTGTTQPPTPYSQPPYNQQYSQSGDPSYANYQNWGYSQTGYGGYNQGWGNYNYYQ